MLLGFSILVPYVGYGAAFLAQLLVKMLLTVMHALASIPFASLTVNISSLQFLCLIGLILCGFALLQIKYPDLLE